MDYFYYMDWVKIKPSAITVISLMVLALAIASICLIYNKRTSGVIMAYAITILIVMKGSSSLDKFAYNQAEKITIKKNVIVQNNIKNADVDNVIRSNEVVVNNKKIKVNLIDGETACISYSGEPKIVLEEVTYNIKSNWTISKKSIEEINNAKRYYLSETYKKIFNKGTKQGTSIIFIH